MFAPNDLAELAAEQLHIVSDNAALNRALGQLWRAAEASGELEDFSGRRNPSPPVRKGWGASPLANAVAADLACDSEFESSSSSHAPEIGLTLGDCESTGLRAKLGKVAESDCSMEQITEFAEVGA